MLELEKLLPKKIPVRRLRVAELIKKFIAEIIVKREIDHKILVDNLITISKVDLSPDLQNAKVYVTSFHTNDSIQLIIELNKLSSKFRFLISKKIKLKTLPHLNFLYDDTLDQVDKINKLLSM